MVAVVGDDLKAVFTTGERDEIMMQYERCRDCQHPASHSSISLSHPIMTRQLILSHSCHCSSQQVLPLFAHITLFKYIYSCVCTIMINFDENNLKQKVWIIPASDSDLILSSIMKVIKFIRVGQSRNKTTSPGNLPGYSTAHKIVPLILIVQLTVLNQCFLFGLYFPVIFAQNRISFIGPMTCKCRWFSLVNGGQWNPILQKYNACFQNNKSSWIPRKCLCNATGRTRKKSEANDFATTAAVYDNSCSW